MDKPNAREKRISKAELIARIQRSRSALEDTLQGLTWLQLDTPGPESWAVKDHLVHLAVWELGIAELLSHRDRFAAMQVKEAVEQNLSEDEINALIQQRHAGLSPAEAGALFQSAHEQMLQVLGGLSDDDLYRPYGYYTPENDGGRPDPVINWIVGNTADHFDQHRGIIQRLLRAAG
jgi:hypothetical protein